MEGFGVWWDTLAYAGGILFAVGAAMAAFAPSLSHYLAAGAFVLAAMIFAAAGLGLYLGHSKKANDVKFKISLSIFLVPIMCAAAWFALPSAAQQPSQPPVINNNNCNSTVNNNNYNDSCNDKRTFNFRPAPRSLPPQLIQQASSLFSQKAMLLVRLR